MSRWAAWTGHAHTQRMGEKDGYTGLETGLHELRVGDGLMVAECQASNQLAVLEDAGDRWTGFLRHVTAPPS